MEEEEEEMEEESEEEVAPKRPNGLNAATSSSSRQRWPEADWADLGLNTSASSEWVLGCNQVWLCNGTRGTSRDIPEGPAPSLFAAPVRMPPMLFRELGVRCLRKIPALQTTAAAAAVACAVEGMCVVGANAVYASSISLVPPFVTPSRPVDLPGPGPGCAPTPKCAHSRLR